MSNKVPSMTETITMCDSIKEKLDILSSKIKEIDQRVALMRAADPKRR